MTDIVERAKAWMRGEVLSPSAGPTLINELVAEVKRLRPRIITTTEELDALPVGSVVRSEPSISGCHQSTPTSITHWPTPDGTWPCSKRFRRKTDER